MLPREDHNNPGIYIALKLHFQTGEKLPSLILGPEGEIEVAANNSW